MPPWWRLGSAAMPSIPESVLSDGCRDVEVASSLVPCCSQRSAQSCHTPHIGLISYALCSRGRIRMCQTKTEVIRVRHWQLHTQCPEAELARRLIDGDDQKRPTSYVLSSSFVYISRMRVESRGTAVYRHPGDQARPSPRGPSGKQRSTQRWHAVFVCV